MAKLLSILRHEYAMQLRRPAGWGVLAAACAVAWLDSLPTAGNLARLEFLGEPAYFVCRSMSLDGLVMVFGLMFLLSGRFPQDCRSGVKALVMAAPVTRGQYVGGKLLGGFLYTYTMLALFLCLNAAAYCLAAPFAVAPGACLAPLLRALAVCALPVSLFIGFLSVALPTAMDIRLFYLLASVLFFVNAAAVGSAESMPFYLITSGDLVKLLWQHPKWPLESLAGVWANLAFLLGGGLLAATLPFWKRGFWRAE